MIFIFSNGGVSHMDTFDHKPKLMAADGKTLGVGGGLSNQQRRLLRPGWDFRPGLAIVAGRPKHDAASGKVGRALRFLRRKRGQ